MRNVKRRQVEFGCLDRMKWGKSNGQQLEITHGFFWRTFGKYTSEHHFLLFSFLLEKREIFGIWPWANKTNGRLQCNYSQLGDFCRDVTTSHWQDVVVLLRIYPTTLKVLGLLKFNIQHPDVDIWNWKQTTESWNILLGTRISRKKAPLKIIFLFQCWDMLVPGRVSSTWMTEICLSPKNPAPRAPITLHVQHHRTTCKVAREKKIN